MFRGHPPSPVKSRRFASLRSALLCFAVLRFALPCFALLNVGVCLLRLARLGEARVALVRAQLLLPEDEVGVLDNMRALVEYEEYQSKHPPALARSVIAEDDDTPGDAAMAEQLTNAAIAMAEAGNLHNAFGLFEQAALANPTDGKLWENLGALRAWCTPTKASV